MAPMVQEYTHTDAFRGTPFREADFGGRNVP